MNKVLVGMAGIALILGRALPPAIARLGLRALAAGSLANLMSAALAGLLIPV